MHLYLCNFIGQVILTSLPEILKEDELQRQNDIKRKRHKMLYKSKLEIFLFLINYWFLHSIDQFITDDQQNIIELEKPVPLSEEAESSNKHDSDEMDEGNNSAMHNIQKKKSEAFRFRQQGQSKQLSAMNHDQNRNSLSGASSSSFIDTEK